MTLSEYLKTMDKEGLAAFARCCGTSAGQLKQVAYGNRRASAGLAVSLDRETGGAIRCEDMRPDIDWAYLRNTRN
ncbi:YdaS family helix-turn-helix protein [Pseudomonas sp. Irchel s3f19]|uniref:transcriptional regulator n=1 Tax=Pseudomonas sp. Irchel s3f19 TaxID=2009146 RepID=UPI000BA4531F|nr:YdaS family helix-turn-helix protein [Pseudomonas sp. Irchel s3f19]